LSKLIFLKRLPSPPFAPQWRKLIILLVLITLSLNILVDAFIYGRFVSDEEKTDVLFHSKLSNKKSKKQAYQKNNIFIKDNVENWIMMLRS